MKSAIKTCAAATALLVPVLMMSSPAARATAASALDELNRELAQLLKPYQDDFTSASLVFDRLETNPERALALSLNAYFKKLGPTNEFTIRVDDLNYDYGDGTGPTTHAKLTIGLDLVQLMGQESLNEMGPAASEIAQNFGKEYAKEYGDAAVIEAHVTDIQNDEAGNLESVSLVLNARIDLDQLPAPMTKEDVLLSQLNISAQVGRKGASVELSTVSNPNYKGFKSDERGLKEEIEALLRRDPKTIAEIQEIFAELDEVATSWVNSKPQ